MRIGRCTAAEKAQVRLGANRVPCACGNEDGVPGANLARLIVDADSGCALEQEIKLLAYSMIMPLGGAAFGKARLGEALHFDRSIGEIENAADDRAVLGGKRCLLLEGIDDHSQKLMDYFNGCTALITGASSGIGEELARQLAPHASTLILAARRIGRLQRLRDELADLHPELRVECYELDLTRRDHIETFVAWLGENNLHPNFLINNAGLGDHGPFEKSQREKVQQILDVNVSALTQLTHGLLPTLRSYPNAAILNVSSVASFLPIPDMAVYAATKAYVTSFSEALRAELRSSGISVTTLCPGPVSTEFGSVAKREDGASLAAPDFLKVPVERVAREALAGVAKDRARVVPGWIVAGAVVVACVLPLFILRPFMRSRH